MKNFIHDILLQLLSPLFKDIRLNNSKQEQMMLINGAILCNLNKQIIINNLQEAEFKIFSQWGDDGIIQYLINNIEIDNKFFIEFGVEDYNESNTRFLLLNNNWSGLIMDGSQQNIEYIKNNWIYWKHHLIAKRAFITAENINDLITDEITGNIGLLHIDIDGNDYWVWKALTVVQADIVIVEYNSVFGINKAITIPYEPDFDRTTTHCSNLYAGASLLALCDLAEEKGYFFIGSNSAGNNAYFVKKEKINTLQILTPQQGYVESKFRESRDERGKLTYLSGNDRIKLLSGMPIFNTRTKTIESI